MPCMGMPKNQVLMAEGDEVITTPMTDEDTEQTVAAFHKVWMHYFG